MQVAPSAIVGAIVEIIVGAIDGALVGAGVAISADDSTSRTSASEA